MLRVEQRMVLQMGPQLDLLIPKHLMVALASTELMAVKEIVSQMEMFISKPGMVVLALTNLMAVKETWSKMGTQLEMLKAR